MMRSIGVMTLEGDLHTMLLKKHLEERNLDLVVHHFSADRVSRGRPICWRHNNTDASSFVTDTAGKSVDVSTLDLVWWRRVNHPQLDTLESDCDSAVVDLINRDSSASMLGAFLSSFRGKWVSDPLATQRAENKLVQLTVASSVGFQIPETLVSQDPKAVRQFCNKHDMQVVVKPVRGTRKRAIYTRSITAEHLEHDDAIRRCPAIYQKMIKGDTHLRVMCFGTDLHAFKISSRDLDWRENLAVPFESTILESELQRKLVAVLNALNLRMGVFDLKIDDSETPVWLEINPQGQFLFCEGMTDYDLLSPFANFLISECESDNQAVNRSCRLRGL